MIDAVEQGYAARIACNGLGCLFAFNGCVVFETSEAMGRVVELGLAPWIVDGVNSIELYVARRSSPSEPYLSLSIVRGALGGSSSPRPLLGYRFSDNEVDPRRDRLIQVLSHQTGLPRTARAWSFERAQPYQNAHRSEMLETVRRVHQALAERDVDLVTRMFRLKLDELSAGVGQAAGLLVEELEQRLRGLCSAQKLELEPFVETEMQVETAAEGRLVHVRGPDGAAPIRGRAPDGPFSLHATLSRIDGRWLVVR